MSRQPDPDAEWSGLLAAAQEGDREAYAAFLTAVLPFLREAADRLTQEAHQRERMVQASLLSIHRLRHTYDPRRPVSRWLAGIIAAHRPRASPKYARLSLFLTPPIWSPFSTSKPSPA